MPRPQEAPVSPSAAQTDPNKVPGAGRAGPLLPSSWRPAHLASAQCPRPSLPHAHLHARLPALAAKLGTPLALALLSGEAGAVGLPTLEAGTGRGAPGSSRQGTKGKPPAEGPRSSGERQLWVKGQNAPLASPSPFFNPQKRCLMSKQVREVLFLDELLDAT